MATDKRKQAASRRKLENAFDVFDKLFEGFEGSSHSPTDYGNHLDDLIEAKEERRRSKERATLEAEAVLFYVERRGKGFTDSICKYCQYPFSHTYYGVGYCSDRCRAASLHELGISWNPDAKSESERWNVMGKGFIPKIIGVAATEVVKQLDFDCMEVVETPQPQSSQSEVDDGNPESSI